MSRYGQLAALLQQQIESGLWQPGERIPSIRQSCKTHHLRFIAAFRGRPP